MTKILGISSKEGTILWEVEASDEKDLPNEICRFMCVGDSKVRIKSGSGVFIVGMKSGWSMDIRVSRVYASGTTAESIIGWVVDNG
jgi:outer membrane protein assembly factor BamB